MIAVLCYVSLGVCAILGHFVILYRRELARRPPCRAPKRGPSPKGLDRKRVEEFSKQLRGLAAAGMDLGEDLAWAPKTAKNLTSASNPGEAVLAAGLQLVESNRRLLGKLAAARSERHEGGVESGERILQEELARRFAELRRQKRAFSFLCLGIDGFARFNRRHGPAAAQAVLRQTAAVSLEALRSMDFVTPYADGRIAVILPGIPLTSAEQVAKWLRTAIGQARFRVGDQDLRVTVGIGMAEAKPDEEPQGLVRRGGAALRAAQESGRNQVYLDSGQAEDSIRPVVRHKRRYPVEKVQRVALYEEGLSPEKANFREVFCTDLSQGGFAYLADRRPNHRRLMVELGPRDEPKYLVAVVKSCARVESETGRQFRVGCMFTGRWTPDKLSAPRPNDPTAEVTGDAPVEACPL